MLKCVVHLDLEVQAGIGPSCNRFIAADEGSQAGRSACNDVNSRKPTCKASSWSADAWLTFAGMQTQALADLVSVRGPVPGRTACDGLPVPALSPSTLG